MHKFNWAMIALYVTSAVLAYGHSYNHQKSTITYPSGIISSRADVDRFVVALVDATLAPLYWSTVYWRKNA